MSLQKGKQRRKFAQLLSIAAMGAVGISGFSMSARADTFLTTWIGPSGQSWNNAANWSAGFVAQNQNLGPVDVFIDGDNPTNNVVEFSYGNGTVIPIHDLTVSEGDTLNLGNHNTLVLTGSNLINHGSINLNSTGIFTSLRVPNVTLSGGGTITMGNNINNNIRGETFGARFTNLDNTIRGAGHVTGDQSLALTNSGTIIADQPTRLEVWAAGQSINTGWLRADGGTLSIRGNWNNTSGTIEALDNSMVQLFSVPLTGGTLRTSAAGTVQMSGNQNWTNLTIGGNFKSNDTLSINLSGVISNSTTADFQSTVPNAINLKVVGSTTLTLNGGGVTTLSGPAVTINGFGTLVSNNTIQGTADLNSIGVVNYGTIKATSTARVFNVSPTGIFTNNGTIGASNGASLTIAPASAITLNNSTGTLLAENGSTITLRSSLSINGGTLATAGSGVIQTDVAQSVLLTNVTNTGQHMIQSAGRDTISGGMTNSGSIIIANGQFIFGNLAGGPNPTITLSGGGMVLLQSSNAGIPQLSWAGTLVSDNIIRGVGLFGSGYTHFHNNGMIDAAANSAGTVLFINLGSSRTLKSTGVIQVSPGAELRLMSGEVDSANGSFNVMTGGTFNYAAVGQHFSVGDVLLDGVWEGAGASKVYARDIQGAGTLNNGDNFMEARSLRIKALATGRGKIWLTAGGGTLGTSRLNRVPQVTSTGLIDLNDHDLIIDYSVIENGPINTLRQLLATGYANGAWNGYGLVSDKARTSTGSKTSLGYLDNVAGTFTSFSGLAVDDTSILIKYTYAGDATLDGLVDIRDLSALLRNWMSSGYWAQGDFNYDGQINRSDLGILAGNWQAGVGNSLGLGFPQALDALGASDEFIPEPAGLGLAMFTAAAGLSRRRKR